MKNSKHLKSAAFLLSLVVASTGIAPSMMNLHNDIETVHAEEVVPTENNHNHTIKWDRRFPDQKAFWDAEMAQNQKMCEEGFVLMKNEGGFLPVKKTDNKKVKVSVFGKNTKTHAYFGFGSSDASRQTIDGDGQNFNKQKYTSVAQAFRDSDSFEINEKLVNFYEDDSKSGKMRLKGDIHSSLDKFAPGCDIGETPVEKYTDDVKKSFKEYNDLAVVMITRCGAEGADLARTSLKGWGTYDDSNKLDSARNWDDHYLQLDKNEVAMMQMVMDNFDNIVVLFNTNAQFECGFLDDDNHYLYTDNNYCTTEEEKLAAMNKIKAGMYIGYTGTNGIRAVPTLLDGTVNPSGHLADTWMRDFKKDPTWQNQGYMGNPDNIRWGNPFTHYEEDVYLGYRYYETRYITESEDTRDAWYNENTIYPFGHGLSYTTFEWSDVKVETSGADNKLIQYHNDGKQGTITASVTIKNTGKVAGKDVVQVYSNPPYTAGGISKAHVNLMEFTKTKLLAPGESQTLTVEFTPYDMSSFDFSDANGNGKKCWELEKGNYNIIVAKDAHDAAQLPTDRTKVVTVDEGFVYDKDPQTGGDVYNRFDDVGGTKKAGNREGNTETEGFRGVDTYMSRDDFDGTFPTHAETKKNGPKHTIRTYDVNEKFDEGKPWYSDEERPNQTYKPRTPRENKIKLWHMAGRDYDDPMWQELLDELAPSEMAELIGNCVYYTIPLPSIDKPRTKEEDGPLGNRVSVSIQWQSAPITAQTFNKEIIYEQGLMMGEGSYYHMDHQLGGIYGPGLETHRSPFAGRNMEYYSEDPVLSGRMCSEFLHGTTEMGNYQLIKHFMLNNCETERGNGTIWASEQAMREIYGKGYELVVKSGYSMGFMSAVSLIGDEPCATSYQLLTGLLRNEWGFKGMVISDMFPRNPDMEIRAGNDLALTGNGKNAPTSSGAGLTSTQLHNIRKCAKNILYVIANSYVMDGYGGSSLKNITYDGSNVIYAVKGVDNTLNINTARYKVASPYEIGYNLTDGTSLPDGMKLNENGEITGAPLKAGTYNFSVCAEEKADENVIFPYYSDNKEYKLVVFEPDKLPDDIIYNENTLGTLKYGSYFEKDIASGAYFNAEGKLCKDVKYSLAPNHVLPKGLTLKDGVISGTVLENDGGFFFTIIAEAEGKTPKKIQYTAKINTNVISYTPVEIPEINAGSGVNINLGMAESSMGDKITYALKEGDTLPEGLEFSSKGVITGVASRACDNHKFTVVITSDSADTVTQDYVMTVKGLVFDDMEVEDMLLNKHYDFDLKAYFNDELGNNDKITFDVKEVVNNSLPTGFNLLSDGRLYGTASDLGEVTFIITATAEGYKPVDATITFTMYDIYPDEIEDDAQAPIDYDKVNQEIKDNNAQSNGCGGMLEGMPIILATLLGASTYVIAKKKKEN